MGGQVHTFHECLIILSGCIHTQSADALVTGQRGDLLIYPAGCWHEERSDRQRPVDFVYFAFDGDAGDAVRRVPDVLGRCATVARWLLEEVRLEGPLEPWRRIMHKE